MSTRSPSLGQDRRNTSRRSDSVTIISSSSSGGSQILNSSPNKRKSRTVRSELDSEHVSTTAKRVKLGPEALLNERICDVDLVSSPERVERQGASVDVESEAKKIHKVQPHTNGNFKSFLDNFHLPDWPFRLFSPKKEPRTTSPDFGIPDEGAARLVESGSKPEMVVPGGPKRPSSTNGNQGKIVRSALDERYLPSHSSKAFDLTSSHKPPVDSLSQHASKRRKTVHSTFDDSFDELQYDKPTNHMPIPRPTKTVSSNIPLLERNDPRVSFGVHEFKTLESTVSSKGRRRPEQNPRYSSNQSSREATVVIDDDEIQDSGPEVAKPAPYKGTAHLAAARPREERATNTRRQRQTASTSNYFPPQQPLSNMSIQDARKANSGARDISNRVDGHKSSYAQNGLHHDTMEEISDEDLHMHKTGIDTKQNRTQTVMASFSKPVSTSINRDGDIPPGLQKRSRKSLGKAAASRQEEHPKFPVTYLRSVLDEYKVETHEDKRHYLQFNLKLSEMTLFANDGDLSDMDGFASFSFDPTSVNMIYYCIESGKVALRTTEVGSNTGNLPNLLLELHRDTVFGFVTYLQAKAEPKVKEFEKDRLDRLFEIQKGNYNELRQRHGPEDVGLLTQNRNRRHDQRPQPRPDVSELTRNGKRSGKIDSYTELPKSKKIYHKFRMESSDNESSNPDVREIKQQRLEGRKGERPEEPKEVHTRQQYGFNGNNDVNRRVTRGQNREVRRITPPPPLRWTDEVPNWAEFWGTDDAPLVFPFGGTKQAPVDKRDIERLDEGEFLNDNLIAFYLRYLEDMIEREKPEVSKRVFFMNTFFYPRLTRGKGRNNIDYDAVKRWTSKVNIFDYDYIVVPVNENAHWYVAIICNAPKLLQPPKEENSQVDEQGVVNERDVVDLDESTGLAGPGRLSSGKVRGSISPDMARQVSDLSIEDGDLTRLKRESNRADFKPRNIPILPNQASPGHSTASSSPSKGRKGKRKSIPPVRKYNTDDPRIITLDSLGLAHSPTCSNLRDFLIQEAKEKLDVQITLAQSSIGMTAKNIPEQDNFCDCGLFLLGYIEGFLDNPDETIHGIMQGKTDMKNTFPKMNATEMRKNMRDLIFKLRREQIVKEYLAKKAKLDAKNSTERKEQQPPPETKEVQSVSASPKPAVTLKRARAVSNDSTAESAASGVPEQRRVPVVEINEPEQHFNHPSLPLDEHASVDDFMDVLAGVDGASSKVHTSIEDPPTKAHPLTIRDSPPHYAHKQSSHKRDSSQDPSSIIVKSSNSKQSRHKRGRSQGLSSILVKGNKPKHPSAEPEERKRMHGRYTDTPPPKSHQRHTSLDHIELGSSEREDSLRADMSPSIKDRKFTQNDIYGIPDSQGEDVVESLRRQKNIGMDGSADEFEDITECETRLLSSLSPRARAGEGAVKRMDDQLAEGGQTREPSVRKQARQSGAGALFGSAKREKRKDTHIIDD